MKVSTLALVTLIGKTGAFATPSARNLVVPATAGRSLFVSATNNKNSNKKGRSLVQMNLFKTLFGGLTEPGPRIPYDTLGYPADEMGKLAEEGTVVVNSEKKPNLAAATFAGGCFWGLELAYQRVAGVEYTAVGYTQGPELKPTYNEVCSGATGHTEAICVYYNPEECSYESLLDTFFQRVDPTTVNGQGNDRGPQYRTGVYTHTPEQMEIAKARFEEEKSQYKRPIASELKEAQVFWPAEKYHQQYLEKGGRFGTPQSTEKGSTETIRCYG